MHLPNITSEIANDSKGISTGTFYPKFTNFCILNKVEWTLEYVLPTGKLKEFSEMFTRLIVTKSARTH